MCSKLDKSRLPITHVRKVKTGGGERGRFRRSDNVTEMTSNSNQTRAKVKLFRLSATVSPHAPHPGTLPPATVSGGQRAGRAPSPAVPSPFSMTDTQLALDETRLVGSGTIFRMGCGG